MKKFLIFIIGVITLCSCSNDNHKYGYLVTIDAPSTYYVMGIRQTLDSKADFKDLGVITDSISVFVNNLKENEQKNSKDLLETYYESINKSYNDNKEKITEETKQTVLKSIIGRSVILIIVPESLVSNNISLDDLMNLYKEKNPEIESHYIYDGASILAEIEVNEDYKRIKDEYGF